MSEQQAILYAICAQPDDDTARLVYADWLQENGDEARAEFIRVQIELARLPECLFLEYPGDRRCDQTFRSYSISCTACESRRRQQELLADPRHFVNWTPSVMHTGSRAGIRYETGGKVGLFGNGFGEAEFSRGFVSRIELTCEAFMQHAEAIFAAHPVTAVRLIDKVPDMIAGDAWWYDEAGITQPETRRDLLPAALLDRPSGAKRSDSAEAAYDWLSARCVAHGRECAGLPTWEPAKECA